MSVHVSVELIVQSLLSLRNEEKNTFEHLPILILLIPLAILYVVLLSPIKTRSHLKKSRKRLGRGIVNELFLITQ
jgi:hypothetical protein